jgi:hypothetical protein
MKKLGGAPEIMLPLFPGFNRTAGLDLDGTATPSALADGAD